MTSTDLQPSGESGSRRSFLQRMMAGTVGLVAGLVPVLAGMAVIFDPLGRKSRGGNWVRVASLDALAPDGRPRLFSVVAASRDAWSVFPPHPIGSVYLRQTSEGALPEALSADCPHLGCLVDFKPASDEFRCPCHGSDFKVDGERIDPASSPSPRSMDTLDVEIRGGNEVWVDYRRFQQGTSEKIEQ